MIPHPDRSGSGGLSYLSLSPTLPYAGGTSRGHHSSADTSSRKVREKLGIEQTRRAETVDELHRKAGIDTIRLFAGEP